MRKTVAHPGQRVSFDSVTAHAAPRSIAPAGEQHPAVFLAPRRKVEPARVGRANVSRLRRENAGERDDAVPLRAHGQGRCEQPQWIREDIGDDDVEPFLRELIDMHEDAWTPFCAAFRALARSACGSMSTPVTRAAPSRAAAMARMPDPQP